MILQNLYLEFILYLAVKNCINKNIQIMFQSKLIFKLYIREVRDY